MPPRRQTFSSVPCTTVLLGGLVGLQGGVNTKHSVKVFFYASAAQSASLFSMPAATSSPATSALVAKAAASEV